MNELPAAYPLAWPDGWERTTPYKRSHSRYRTPLSRSFEKIGEELASWSSVHISTHFQHDWVVSTNMPPRANGRGPLAAGREPSDPGAAVWWFVEQDDAVVPRVVACDSWRTVAENLRACCVVIESLKAMDRAKATEMLRRTSTTMVSGLAVVVDNGVKAPRRPVRGHPKQRPTIPWYVARLGLKPPFTRQDVLRAYKACVVAEHPDRGGSHEAFLELERARDEAFASLDSPGWQEVRL